MTHCPLCGEREHQGKPCYAAEREQWREKRLHDFFASLRDDVYDAELTKHPTNEG